MSEVEVKLLIKHHFLGIKDVFFNQNILNLSSFSVKTLFQTIQFLKIDE